MPAITETPAEKKVSQTEEFRALIAEQIRKCIEDPVTYQKEPLSPLTGLWHYHCRPPHQCYWNCSFVVAIMCDLWFGLKQQAAWAILCNGKIGYFEWRTHSGYEMAPVFRYLGIDFDPSVIPHETSAYCHLPEEIARQIAETFELPTVTYRKLAHLTHYELEFRQELNRLHPMLSLE